MWNVNIRKGSIWTTKSLNQYEDLNYRGMRFGNKKVLILSAYTDINGNKIFTYLDIPDKKHNGYIYVNINKDKYYVEIDTIQTGDQRALEEFIDNVSISDMNKVIKEARQHFNLQNFKEDKKIIRKEEDEVYQQRIFKFGIDVYVTENENVKIDKSKKIILSSKAKDDIIYNSKTDEDIRILCDKYKIYPIKAMKEIRNRLAYQHKQKEG